MNAMPAMAHLSDADLVRHIDGEGSHAEHARRQAHLRACRDCAAREERLRRRSGEVSAWLARADHDYRAADPPAARHRPDFGPWLRAAAIVLLLAAPLAAVPPVREWVAERIGLGTDAAQEAPAAPAAEAAPVIRFTPAPGTFTVRVDDPAPGASLVLGRADGPDAVFEGAGGEQTPPVVSDAELRLTAGAARRYALRLPAGVRDVLVLVNGRATRVPGPALDAGKVVALPVNR